MYQGPVRVSHFEKCDAEEVSYANYGHDSQGNIVCINTSCLWMGPGKDFLSKKGIQGKCCTSQKESQSLWSVCVPAMAAECAEGPRRGNRRPPWVGRPRGGLLSEGREARGRSTLSADRGQTRRTSCGRSTDLKCT